MRKLYIFDLDGVLVDSCNIHYIALNQALAENGYETISQDDHISRYNGLSTRAKLASMPGVDVDTVFHRKQVLTQLSMKSVTACPRLREAILALKARGDLVMCASNCIRDTVSTVLVNLGISELFDAVFTNEDVKDPKPSPEIYLQCIKTAGVRPEDTLIFEDSYVGLRAAVASGAAVHCVKRPSDLTVEYVLSAEENLTRTVNIVIPMAGNGSRFANAGYKDPKPFIPVFGEPMISWVVRNLGVRANYTFIIRKEFEETYSAHAYLNTIAPGCSIVTVDSLTEGAACTVLLAKEHINNDHPLVIINSDQYIEFEGHETAFKFIFDFLYHPKETGLDGKISTFDGGRHPKWSYAKVGDDGLITEVREKDPFSDHATTGLYMWRRGSDFVKYAGQMIAKNIRVNNEFYVVPVFNEAIADDKKFVVCKCSRMWGIGVPEDLEYFIHHFKSRVLSS
jgi:HAD superfamily hydrolase (TIGR01509 family)